MIYREAFIQECVVRWVKNNHPEILFTCAPAVGKTPMQGRRNKLMGLCKGWPDLFFAIPQKGYYGLFIELKSEDGVLKPYQRDILEQLNGLGYKAVVCRSSEEAIDRIKEYIQ